jgi:hypothetical protein
MSWIETEKKIDLELSLPPVGLNVIVQCDGFRCLAYRNTEGQWISAYDNRELDNVLCVVSRPRTRKATLELVLA